MTASRFLSGQFLLSMPGMGDSRFERAVVAICSHDEEAALGIVVNHTRGDVDTHGLLSQLDIDPGDSPKRPVFSGGPVETARGFVLHSLDYQSSGTLSVAGRWGLTATLDVLRDIAEGRGPKHWLVALGYTGWGEGQLEDEMLQHGWMTARGRTELLWKVPVEERWKEAFSGEGLDVGLIASAPGRA